MAPTATGKGANYREGESESPSESRSGDSGLLCIPTLMGDWKQMDFLSEPQFPSGGSSVAEIGYFPSNLFPPGLTVGQRVPGSLQLGAAMPLGPGQ